MLWKREHVDLICAGLKTETRRLGKRRWILGNEYRCYTRPQWAKPPGVPFAKIRVVALQLKRLSWIDNASAVREGYTSVASFLEAFRTINKLAPDVDPTVWVVRFEVAEDLRESWRTAA